MPVKITKNKDGTYKVSTPNQVHAKHTTLAKAKKQEKIINAADAGHPIGKKTKGK